MPPLAAFCFLCFFWGSTWIALKLGVQALPPVLFAGLRFVVAGALLGGWVVLTRRAWPLTATQMARAVVPALLMIAINYGLMAWGIVRVESAVAAIVNLGTIPIAMLVLAVIHRQERVTAAGLAGLALGVTGLTALFAPRLLQPGLEVGLLGGLAIVAGATVYAWGSVLSKSALADLPITALAAFQMSLGGTVLVMAGVLLEPVAAETWARLLRVEAWGTLAYLVVSGSLLGFTVYLWLLKRWPASRVANYAFVAPVIAAFLGWAVLGEQLHVIEVLAAVVLLFGAWLSLRARA